MNTQAESSEFEANNAAQLLRIIKRFKQLIPSCVIVRNPIHIATLSKVYGRRLQIVSGVSRTETHQTINKSPKKIYNKINK